MSETPDEMRPQEHDGTPVATGHESVDAVVDSMAGLDELPVSEHVAVFEQAHESLRRALSDASQG